MPAYLFVVYFGGLFIWLISIYYDIYGSGSFRELLSYWAYNSILLNFLHPCVVLFRPTDSPLTCAVNGSLWTIKFEFLFYCILPFLVLFLRRFSQLICFLLSLSFLLISCFIESIYIVLPVCFVSGVLLSFSKSLWLPTALSIRISPLSRILLVLFSTIAAGLFLPYPIAGLFIVFICFLSTNDKNGVNFLYFGDLSYGIYLVHYPLIRFFIISQMHLSLSFLPLTLLTLLLSALLAHLLYRFIEVPFLSSGSYYRTTFKS